MERRLFYMRESENWETRVWDLSSAWMLKSFRVGTTGEGKRGIQVIERMNVYFSHEDTLGL